MTIEPSVSLPGEVVRRVTPAKVACRFGCGGIQEQRVFNFFFRSDQERISTEHKVTKNSLDAKLQIGFICSILIRSAILKNRKINSDNENCRHEQQNFSGQSIFDCISAHWVLVRDRLKTTFDRKGHKFQSYKCSLHTLLEFGLELEIIAK